LKELNKKELLLYFLSYYTNIPFVKPLFINFGLTHRCNLRCKICETWEETPRVKEELTLQELKRVILEIGHWGRINVSFAGGEPFIRKDDLLECIRFAKQNGLITHVTTNGTFITKTVANEITASGLDYLQVSLDGVTKRTNDYIRGKGTFKKAMTGLKYLLKAKQESKSDIKISITMVVTNKNVDEILAMHDFVKDMDLHEVAYNPYNIDTSYTKNKKYEDDEFWVTGANLKKLRRISKKLIQLKKREGRIGTPFFTLKLMPEYFEKKEKFRRGICLAGFTYMYVKPNGEVDVCGKGPSLNVREHSIREIWYSPNFAKTRLKIRKCKRPCLMLCFPRIERVLGGGT